MFRLVRLSLIKQYSATANMVSYTETVEYCRVDNGLVFHTLIADGKEYELENSLTWKNNEINWQYYIKSDDVVLKDLRDTKEYKVVARYGDWIVWLTDTPFTMALRMNLPIQHCK